MKLITFFPVIFAAIDVAKNKLQFTGNPKANNPSQEKFLTYRKDVKFTETELKTEVSEDSEVVNKFFKDNGFGIKLPPCNPGDFAIGSILSLKLQWKTAGSSTTISKDKQSYKAFELESFNTYIVEDKEVHVIDSENGDQLFVFFSKEPKDSFELQELALKYAKTGRFVKADYLTVPNVDIDTNPVPVKFLDGLGVGTMSLASCTQQSKFSMDENGAKAESAFGALMVRSCVTFDEPVYKVIDRPFVAVVVRDGVPVFSAYCDESSWTQV